jgi:hypothetical protein
VRDSEDALASAIEASRNIQSCSDIRASLISHVDR